MSKNTTYVNIKQRVIDDCHAILGEDLLKYPEKVTLEDLQKLCKYLNIECTNELSSLILFNPENNLIPCLRCVCSGKNLKDTFQLVDRPFFEYLLDKCPTYCSDIVENIYK